MTDYPSIRLAKYARFYGQVDFLSESHDTGQMSAEVALARLKEILQKFDKENVKDFPVEEA